MAPDSRVLLTLPSRPENVLVVRHTLSGVAEVLGLGVVERNDLYTAVTEACNNVVTHAYEGADGPMSVSVRGNDAELSVLVTDLGAGLPAQLDGAGLGLHLIRATADRVSLTSGEEAGGGTRLQMIFLRGAVAFDGARTEDPGWPSVNASAAGVRLVCSSRAVAVRVLPRALAAIAAAASFSTAALRDLELLGGWFAAHADEEGEVTMLAVPSLRRLEVELEPYSAEPESLARAAGDLLVESLRSEQATSSGRLRLAIGPPMGAASPPSNGRQVGDER